jgi:hypothetical protein
MDDHRMKPLAIDLFCGLGGWTEGLLAEGFDVIGFDIKRHEYGEHCYPAQLVIQDVLTLHGSQFKNAAIIVASPPCQEYSYMAMPWKLAKAKAAAIRADTTGAELERLNRLFNACLRIQLEASVAARCKVPLIIENVRGAQPWVGRARWSFGSFYLWGDVPALMPMTIRAPKFIFDDIKNGQRRNVDGVFENGLVTEGYKSSGLNWSDRTKRGQDFTRVAGQQALNGIKQGGDWFNQSQATSICRLTGSKSPARKAASALIAKIPLSLSRHIAATFRP